MARDSLGGPMTDATPDSGAKNASPSIVGVVFVAVVAVASIVYVVGKMGAKDRPEPVIDAIEAGAARCTVAGKVTDAAGKPVGNATIMCKWIVNTDNGQVYQGLIVRQTDAAGNYMGVGEFNSELLVKAKEVTMNCELRACPEHRDSLPSETIEWTAGRVSSKEQNLQLGKLLPTVPLHVVDTAGKPVEKIWAKALRVDKPRDDVFEPRRQGVFPDGVMPMPVPLDSFNVKVQLKGTGRFKIVGPFDPSNLPDHIDVTLPDK